MPDSRVLVVGTTRDYIEYLEEKLPGKLVFLTDPMEYPEGGPGQGSLSHHIIVPLSETGRVLDELEVFQEEQGVKIKGVACFDCESLILASEIARGRWPFTRTEAVLNSRDKFRSKKLWRSAGISCPAVLMAGTELQAISFIDAVDGPVVMKPAMLSGSELTYRCETHGEVTEAFNTIMKGLRSKKGDPVLDRDGLIDDDAVLCEEFIEGREFSSDFIYRDGRLTIIRVAGKHLAPSGPAGTAQAYELPPPDFPMHMESFEQMLRSAVKALGIQRCMGMADFIFRGRTPYFIEITPRPGGDCLPQLIYRSSGFDIRTAHIDFAADLPVDIPEHGRWKHLVGLRVHSGAAGTLRSVRVKSDGLSQRILEESWIAKPGSIVKLPPRDYKSWLLGHLIFEPVPGIDISEQVRAVRDALEIDIEQEIHS